MDMDAYCLYSLVCSLSIQAFFKVADKSGDDRISFDEYSHGSFFVRLSVFSLSIQAFFKVADKSGDDRISFDEYMEVMLGRRTEQLHE